MLGPLVKAQLVAFLTKKLLDSKVFVGGVEQLHGTVSKLQRGAYDTLLQATREPLYLIRVVGVPLIASVADRRRGA
jgi:hypothetical protein